VGKGEIKDLEESTYFVFIFTILLHVLMFVYTSYEILKIICKPLNGYYRVPPPGDCTTPGMLRGWIEPADLLTC
jgi:hypothetical protein